MSSSNILPISFVVAALEPGKKYTPQQLAEAIVERLQAVSGQAFALFVAGSTEPPYDVGPWAKNGNEWQYFSTTEGRYVPFLVPQESLKFYVGQDDGINAPDPSKFLFWIVLDDDGMAIDIRTFHDGAWKGVYYAKTDVYTKAELDSFFEPTVAGKKQIHWDNVINKPSAQSYAMRAESTVAQNMLTTAVSAKLANLTNERYDTGEAYDAPNSRYTAKVAGIYRVSFGAQVDNAGGELTSMSLFVRVIKNSVVNEGGVSTNYKDPEGQRWFMFGSIDVLLALDDYIELWGEADDFPGVGSVDWTNLFWCASLVQTT